MPGTGPWSGGGEGAVTSRQGPSSLAWAPGQEPRPCRETPLSLQAPPDPCLQQPSSAHLLFLHSPGAGPGPAFPTGRGPGAQPHSAQSQWLSALILAAGLEGRFISLAHVVQRKSAACTGRSGTACTTGRRVGAGPWHRLPRTVTPSLGLPPPRVPRTFLPRGLPPRGHQPC